jgi:hypothetical protein
MADENTTPETPAPVAVKQPTLFAQPERHAPAASPTIPMQVIDELAASRKTATDEAAARKALEAEREEMKATLAKMQEQIGLSDRQKAELAAKNRAEAIRNAATLAAVKHGAVSESQVVKLILDELDEVDGKVVSKADAKVAADDYVAAFLKANPHMQKTKVAQGSGASPFPSAAPSATPVKYDLSTADGLTAYARAATYRPGQQPTPVTKPGA